MKAAGLIAVAGRSSRMGAFKPLLPINGRTMIENTIDVFVQAGVRDLFVVIGKNGKQIIQALSGTGARFVWNHQFETTDMFFSVQLGLAEIARSGGVDAVFLLPGDMPAVPPRVLGELEHALSRGPYDVVFPSDGAKRLHPPLVRADCVRRLLEYGGGDGMRGAFRQFAGRIGYVLTDAAGCAIDVDTPKDYARVCAHMEIPERTGRVP